MHDKRFRIFAVMMMLLFAVAACGGGGGDNDPTVTPPPAADEDGAQAVPAPSEIPPGDSPVQPTPTVTQDALPTPTPFVRATLPPSFTPTPDLLPTATATPLTEISPTEAVANDAPVPTPRPECATFLPDFENSTQRFDFGTTATIAWTAVENAQLYRVIIFDEQGFEVHTRLVEQTLYEIPADALPFPGIYGWSVEPLDSVGIQMCIGVGDAIQAQG